MKKTLGILSHSSHMAAFYGQIIRRLFGDYAEIRIGSAEDLSIRSVPKCELYLSSITSYDVLKDPWVREYMPPEEQTVRMDLTFSRAAVDLLKTYPEGTKALLVNQNKHMTMECIAQLYHLGISNIEFYPCYPGVESCPGADLVFTVGEMALVPKSFPHAIDIGSRMPSANVVSEIALKLGNSFFLEGKRFRQYRRELANVDYSLQKITTDSLTTENRLEMILNSMDEGIVCADEDGVVRLINKRARLLLGVSRSAVLNRPAAEVLPALPFQAPENGERQDGPRLLNIHGVEYGFVTTPLRLQGQSLGTCIAFQEFREAEKLQNALRLQKTRKSHTARFRFEDIIGSSPAVSRAREIARRVAGGDAAILLEGESGTGKALFAQAIHNASGRAGEAFVSVNCAAMNGELPEAELFGCEEGYDATHPGGRTGLLEYAHRGTLFLEDIESMGPRLQAALLRVLREKEITRLGAEDPVPVDIRVISSCEGDMQKLVRDGMFSRDLFYRLNVIPIRIPPLRERKGDIKLLADHFRVKMDADFELTSQARLTLMKHPWPGNIRELKNCIEYLKYTGQRIADEEDLPEAIRESGARRSLRAELEKKSGISIQEYWVLRELSELYTEKKGMGRQLLADVCRAHGNTISEHEARDALNRLEEKGYVEIRPGRGGSRLTESGYLYIRQLLYDAAGDEPD